MLVGYLIGIAILSTISAMFIKLGVKIVAKETTSFAGAFVISAISLLGAFFAQDLFNTVGSQSSFVQAAPAFVFLFLSWLLISQFIKFGGEGNSKNYVKSFLVAIIQSVALFITGIIFSILLVILFSVVVHTR